MVDIPTKVHDTMKNCDMAYNPLRGRSTKGERKKKGKIREEGQSSRSGKGGELDTLSTQSPLSLNGWKGDISMVPIYFGEDSISSTQVGSFKLDLPSCPGPSLCWAPKGARFEEEQEEEEVTLSVLHISEDVKGCAGDVRMILTYQDTYYVVEFRCRRVFIP